MNRNGRIPALTTAALALALALVACAGQPPGARMSAVSHAELLSGDRLGVSRDAAPTPVELAAVNDDMRAFLRQHVPAGLGPTRTIELILQALLQDGLELRYDNFRTYTAEEAFYAREGNCMSFTNLFVALAREAGIKAHYQEVEIPPSWTVDGDTWMYNLHINALVKLPVGEQVVDFNLGDYDRDYQRWLLSDEEALARYHNNMGVHWMEQGEPEKAFLHLRAALGLQPQAAHVWTNLGTLYRRLGDLAAAEAGYLRAVTIGDDAAANSNLARLYAQLGEQELSDWYRDRVQLFRRRNPYYLFHLAEEAYAGADYASARQFLLTAIRREPGEHEFYRLLGLTYLQLGKLPAARAQVEQASRHAGVEEQLRYRNKLDLLVAR